MSIYYQQQAPLVYCFFFFCCYNCVDGILILLTGLESNLFSTFLAIISKASEIFAELKADTSVNYIPFIFAKLYPSSYDTFLFSV